jgi:uncharacterized oligopeptide transporter (OPT) family protein
MSDKKFVPFIAPETAMKEFTFKAVVTGACFGIIFGAATVYLALKAGLTVSASIPIAVMSIALSKLFLRKEKQKSENNGEEEDLRKVNLFATGLVAGGAIAGVNVAFLSANETVAMMLKKINLEEFLTHQLGEQGYFVMGSVLFFTLAFILYRVAISKEVLNEEN